MSFWKKNNLKNTPKNDVVLKRKKKGKRKRKKKKTRGHKRRTSRRRSCWLARIEVAVWGCLEVAGQVDYRRARLEVAGQVGVNVSLSYTVQSLNRGFPQSPSFPLNVFSSNMDKL
jgi:hypothetical protein